MKITPCLLSHLRTSAIYNNSNINKVREMLVAILGLFIVLIDLVFKVMEDLLNRVEE
jgi:ABC-type phosphate transport system permease subunit